MPVTNKNVNPYPIQNQSKINFNMVYAPLYYYNTIFNPNKIKMNVKMNNELKMQIIKKKKKNTNIIL